MAFTIGWFQNIGFKYLFLILWGGVSVTLFVDTVVRFRDGLEYYYNRHTLGITMYIARGSGTVISLNCAAILLPMCHTCITLIRRLFKNLNYPIYLKCETKSYHIYFAYIILLFSACHVISHLIICQQFHNNFNEHILDANPFPNRPTYKEILFKTIPGITGLMLVFVILLLVATSIKCIRHHNFNVFWYTHRLFVVFYILVLIHGIRGPMRQQINVNKHYPGCRTIDNAKNNMRARDNEKTTKETPKINIEICNATYMKHQWQLATSGLSDHTDGNVSDTYHCFCSEGPLFEYIQPKIWQWLCLPVVLYICDFVWRLARRSRSIDVVAVQVISTEVYEIVFRKPHISMKPGQYVLLKCPDVSTLEWHPFSVVQVATKPNGWLFSVCIKRSGDWTDNIIEKLNKVRSDYIHRKITHSKRFPRFYMDGPFSSVMEHVVDYKVGVCIAGGAGVTPFISHLLHIRRTFNTKSKLKKLYFIVVSKDERLLTWCGNICKTVYKVLKYIDKDLLDIRLYLTRGNISKQSCTFISDRIHYRRPNLEKLFSYSIPSKYRGSVGVFCCGPNSLTETVKQHCIKHSNLMVKLCFHKETF